MRETGERSTERKGESRTAAVRPPSHTCHTGSERWPLFPGYTSSNTVPSRIRGRTSAARVRPTGRFLKNALERSSNADFCNNKKGKIRCCENKPRCSHACTVAFLHTVLLACASKLGGCLCYGGAP